jgi:hypothetical protein
MSSYPDCVRNKSQWSKDKDLRRFVELETCSHVRAK